MQSDENVKSGFRSLEPMAFVRSVPESIRFYARLGFRVHATHAPEGATDPVWASLRSGEATFMIALASEPVNADKQAVMFYLYVDDVAAKHAELGAAGVTVGAITYPFYNPRGEFRVIDPDGYVLMITHFD